MRGLLLVSVLLGMAYFLFLNKKDVERLELDEAENIVNQVEQDVNDAMAEAQRKIDEALPQN